VLTGDLVGGVGLRMEATSGAPTRIPAWRVAAVSIGNALEFYDFLTFSVFAVYIAEAFFPGRSPAEKLYASLATFWAGFLTRPLGALVLGPLGDRIGRRPAMTISFVLIGLGMLGIALTPPITQIGLAAPVLAVVFRLVQGFAVGGAVGPTTAYMFEAAPPDRRGLYAAFQYSSQGVAVATASLVGWLLDRTLGARDLAAWGWRIAFLAGVAIIPLGLWLRGSLPEVMPTTISTARPRTALAPHARMIICGFLLLSATTVTVYVRNYTTTYAIDTLKLDPGVAFGGGVVSALMSIVFSLAGGALSDRLGRRPVILIFALAAAAAVWPVYWWLVHAPGWPSLFVGTAVIGALLTLSASPIIAALAEGMPSAIRSGGVALVYALAISIFGGGTQFVLARTIHESGNPMTPAWFILGAIALCIPAALSLRESAPARAA
jgi:MFS family permease